MPSLSSAHTTVTFTERATRAVALNFVKRRRDACLEPNVQTSLST